MKFAHLIISIITGGPIKSDALWTMMKQLRNRIIKMLEEGLIRDIEEKAKTGVFRKNKKHFK